MSRIGRNPITVPSGVEITISNGNSVKVKGSKGTLERTLPGDITLSQVGSVLTVVRPNDETRNKAQHGLSRTLVANMIVGVSEGFTKTLEIIGTGYRAQAKGADKLELALGFSHPVNIDAPAGITFDVPAPTQIIIKGIDKELVGQVAADIRKIRKPEPYKGKGVRYQGEYVQRKAGKAGKK
jgi:large subunit ribosomal protein L6